MKTVKELAPTDEEINLLIENGTNQTRASLFDSIKSFVYKYLLAARGEFELEKQRVVIKERMETMVWATGAASIRNLMDIVRENLDKYELVLASMGDEAPKTTESIPTKVSAFSKQFRKKPVVVEAIRWLGTNYWEIDEFCGSCVTSVKGDSDIRIRTLDSIAVVSPGDWIIRGIKGEFYPCKDDILHATHELVV